MHHQCLPLSDVLSAAGYMVAARILAVCWAPRDGNPILPAVSCNVCYCRCTEIACTSHSGYIIVYALVHAVLLFQYAEDGSCACTFKVKYVLESTPGAKAAGCFNPPKMKKTTIDRLCFPGQSAAQHPALLRWQQQLHELQQQQAQQQLQQQHQQVPSQQLVQQQPVDAAMAPKPHSITQATDTSGNVAQSYQAGSSSNPPGKRPLEAIAPGANAANPKSGLPIAKRFKPAAGSSMTEHNTQTASIYTADGAPAKQPPSGPRPLPLGMRVGSSTAAATSGTPAQLSAVQAPGAVAGSVSAPTASTSMPLSAGVAGSLLPQGLSLQHPALLPPNNMMAPFLNNPLLARPNLGLWPQYTPAQTAYFKEQLQRLQQSQQRLQQHFHKTNANSQQQQLLQPKVQDGAPQPTALSGQPLLTSGQGSQRASQNLTGVEQTLDVNSHMQRSADQGTAVAVKDVLPQNLDPTAQVTVNLNTASQTLPAATANGTQAPTTHDLHNIVQLLDKPDTVGGTSTSDVSAPVSKQDHSVHWSDFTIQVSELFHCLSCIASMSRQWITTICCMQ